jgi:hypothetical protein
MALGVFMFRILSAFALLVSFQVNATQTIKVKRDNTWPDLKVAVDNTWPDCKIKFEDTWPDVIVQEDDTWPDIKVTKDQTWPDIKVKEDATWPDVKVGGTRNLILAAAACPGAQKILRQAKSSSNLKLNAFFSLIKPDRKCDSDDDCPGFANSCFAGHCTNP